MIVIPSDVALQTDVHLRLDARGRPVSRRVRQRVSRDVAVREIARCFLTGAGLTMPGELARIVGLSRPEAGLGIARWSRKDSRRAQPGAYTG